MRQPVIFNSRNLYDPRLIASFGIEYHCIGRPTAGLPARPGVPVEHAFSNHPPAKPGAFVL